jgi:hypothetical protein
MALLSHIIYVAQDYFCDTQISSSQDYLSNLSCYNVRMISRDLKSLIARVRVWPKGLQEEAMKLLRELEEEAFIGPETMQELHRSHQEALRGEGVSLEEIKERLSM